MELLNTSLNTANENMAFDERLFNTFKTKQKSFFRCYTWKERGLTQSEKRNIPENLSHIDHGFRCTGGGIVFHCPNDIVWSYGVPIINKNPSPKDVMATLKNHFQSTFEHFDIHTTAKTTKSTPDISFCASYDNPYELAINDTKIFGLALKKTATYILVQGVLHVAETAIHFNDIHTMYKQYFTKGIPQLNEPTIYDAFKRKLTEF